MNAADTLQNQAEALGRTNDARLLAIASELATFSPERRAFFEQLLLEAGVDIGQLPIVPHREATDTFPLSYAQQQLWVIDQLEPGNPAYNLHVAVRLRGRLDIAMLARGLNNIVQRHAVFRTRFNTVKRQPVQTIIALRMLPLPLIDLRALPAEVREATALMYVTAEAQRSFDLSRAPLLRTVLLRLDAGEHVLLLTLHHIISDAWSLGVFIRELAALYDAFIAGKLSPLPDLPIQYTDFAHWQRQWLQGELLANQFAYWKERLGGVSPRLELPTDHPRPEVQTFRGMHQAFVFPKPLSRALVAESQRQGMTLFMTLLAAFNIVLHYYTGCQDIVVGTDVANRSRAEIEGLIGFFVNQLVLRTDLADNPTCRELLRRVREVALGAYAHQDLPFAKLVEMLNPERSLKYAPLFQVKLVLQSVPMPTLDHADLSITSLDVDIAAAQLDLILSIAETDRGLEGELEYNVDLFDAARISRLIEHFEIVLGVVITEPDHTLKAIGELLAEADQRRQTLQEQECEAASQQRLKLAKRKTIHAVTKEETK